MIISINWLKEYTDIDMPIDELTKLIGSRLVEIEEVIDLGAKYKDVLIARVVECEDLPESDHLHVCKIDDGGAMQGVERDEKGYIQVVCGAPNIRSDLIVAWLPPGSIVPQTYSQAEPFKLDSRKLRGVISHGMIASATELDIFEDHTGILELDTQAAPGAAFAEVYGLNDYLLDIENKSLTHRPDCFGVIGFAREVAAIQNKPFRAPEWFNAGDLTNFVLNSSQESISVKIEDSEMCGRYQAVVIDRLDQSVETPLAVKIRLASVGLRPISRIVDITNYLMMTTGQPLHAFDYAKLTGGSDAVEITVRGGREGETLALLDGRNIELASDDIVIAAGGKAVALAGAMGGADTEVDSSTTKIVLESASFNLYNLRATQMRHGIFSEAITRFTKGQPASLTAPVLAEAINSLAPGQVIAALDEYPSKTVPIRIDFKLTSVNEILGTNFSSDVIIKTLESVGFKFEANNDKGVVVVPWWRNDIHISEDLVEEIGRIHGFDSIKPVLPRRDFSAVQLTTFDQLRSTIRSLLVRGGANEVLTYSFVHGDLLRQAGQKPEESYRIINSLSPELQYYRQSLTPSLLSLIHPNVKLGYDRFAIFEINKTHIKKGTLDDGVPAEMHRLGLVYANAAQQPGAAYYDTRRLLDFIGNSLGLKLEYRPVSDEPAQSFAAPFEPKRSATIRDTLSNQTIGIIGEYRRSVSKSFKLPTYSAGFEILPEAILLALSVARTQYQPLSKYPSIERDICFKVPESCRYGTIFSIAENAIESLEYDATLNPVDIYHAENADTKNVTLRVRLTSKSHTLTSQQANEVLEKVANTVVSETGAEVI